MKSKRLVLSILIALLLVSFLSVKVLADKDVNIMIDGKEIEFEKDQIPFIKDGTTYLSVRSISEALGVDINWDKEGRFVYLLEKPEIKTDEKLDYIDFLEEYNIYSTVPKEYSQKEYKEGFKKAIEEAKANKNLKLKVDGKEVKVENINLNKDLIYPIYNELDKIKFSIAYADEDLKINKYENDKLVEDFITLIGGNSRFKAVKKIDGSFEDVNLVSKNDVVVDLDNKIATFEMSLKDIYAIEIPEHAFNIEFIRNKDTVRIYIGQNKFFGRDKYGKLVEAINKDGRIYLPLRAVANAFDKDVIWNEKDRTVNLKDLEVELIEITAKELFEKNGSAYEKKLASSIQKEDLKYINPRTKNITKLQNAVEIPDGKIKLNKKFKTIRGYHTVGIEIFKNNKNEDYKFNTGTIKSGNKVIYEAEKHFKDTKTGINMRLTDDKAKLKKYGPSNIVYFEIDVEGLDEIEFNNFQAVNLEFVK